MKITNTEYLNVVDVIVRMGDFQWPVFSTDRFRFQNRRSDCHVRYCHRIIIVYTTIINKIL